MYSYEYDPETGGLLLNSTPLMFSNEPRPVYYRELDILGFDKYFQYAKDDSVPYMWAEANKYYYRGRKVAQTKGGSLYTAPELVLLEEAEPDGTPLRPVDIPAMVEKNREVMANLVQDTVKRVFNTYIAYKDKVDVFYVAFSGGKDSVVTLDIVQRALPHNAFLVLFGDTQMEFPDTYDVVDKVEKECTDSGIAFYRSKSKMTPEETWNLFGPPAQRNRWCCSVHKTAPQILLLRDLLHKADFRGMAFTGVRAEESAARNEYDSISCGEKVKGQYSCHIILEWGSAELYNYIYENNLVLNAAYKCGNSRAGCLVCPMAALKNMFFKEVSYSVSKEGRRTTTTFNDIILKTTSKELSSKASVEEFMNTGGWKARRSGRELSFGHNNLLEDVDKNKLTITLLKQQTDWQEWIKTIGETTINDNGQISVVFEGRTHWISWQRDSLGHEVFQTEILSGSKHDVDYISAVRTVFRKSAHCIGCEVCASNCPHGFIVFEDGKVSISDRCVKCRKCHEVFYGCLLANSVRLPRGEKKMGSIDRYGNMGIEYKWVVDYFEKCDGFWASSHNLGTNQVKYLKYFLNDAEITTKGILNAFGARIKEIGIDTTQAWGLMLVNLVYTSEFNWWVENIEFGTIYTPSQILSMLDESMSENSRTHVVSAYRNIFISNSILGKDIGCGDCDYEVVSGKRKLKTITRKPWESPDPRVILYALYKFAEACDGYYQFTLTRLLNHDVDSNGISPSQIFGLSREMMEKLLTGLSINYPEFINASFVQGLDSIVLRSEKTSQDVLGLF